ncbi:MAG: hypothetical protein WBO47_12320 [Gammaproteobacteria bacterium]
MRNLKILDSREVPEHPAIDFRQPDACIPLPCIGARRRAGLTRRVLKSVLADAIIANNNRQSRRVVRLRDQRITIAGSDQPLDCLVLR